MTNAERETRYFQPSAINADGRIIPWLEGKDRSFSMTIAQFPDHGRPCFVGSAIKSNPVLLELARGLTPEESKKANERFKTEVEMILDGDEIRRVGTLSSRQKDKPDIYRITVGEPYDPKGLRLYYTRGNFSGAPAVYLLAIARNKDAAKVDRILEDAGYDGKKNWNKKKIH